jgi:outer membrane protein OmpA-like peptidoglycan-associated protein
MPHVHTPLQAPSRYAIALAAFACFLPLATASAQSSQIPSVRITSNEVEVQSNLHSKGETLMRAPKGTVLDAFYVVGDRYVVRDENWYWVLLPRDAWGTRQTGWVSGRDVEVIPPPPVTRSANDAPAFSIDAPRRTAEPAAARAPEPTRPAVAATNVAPAAPARLEVSEVVLNFAFDKSDLSDEARTRLDRAVEMLKTQAQGVSFALEGHADAVGTDPYNEKLGLARAKAVSKYLAEQHRIVEGKISTATFGEDKPAAPNTTAEGRAQNRRVVIKVGP